ncbi:LOW QUALITY PROTEIN: lysozyme C, milk isozyme-like [Hipposideros larvatus]
MRSILIIPILSCFFAAYNAKVFSKCELARKLKAHGMDGFYDNYSLANWVCMAEHESGFNTEAFNGKNSDGTRDYGIFQINNKWWCKDNTRSSKNACNIICNSKNSIPSQGWVERDRVKYVPRKRDFPLPTQPLFLPKFQDDDINDDILCAKRVVKDPNRMSAWRGWENHCKNKDLSRYLADCRL